MDTQGKKDVILFDYGIRKPSSTQLLKAVKRLKNVIQIGENFFQILFADTKIYTDAIRK